MEAAGAAGGAAAGAAADLVTDGGVEVAADGGVEVAAESGEGEGEAEEDGRRGQGCVLKSHALSIDDERGATIEEGVVSCGHAVRCGGTCGVVYCKGTAPGGPCRLFDFVLVVCR